MQSGRWIALFSVVNLVAVFLFCKGFLLTRIEFPDVSHCNLDHDQTGRNASGCWSDIGFDRVVMVVLDALRFDFIAADGRMAGAMHVAQMPKLLNMVEDAGNSAVLMKFVADPPTNTLQRLKAILTGSLPTFLDVGTAFAAAALEEDNVLSQLKRNGGKMVALGDDTWQQLFPDFFDISLPFPSFNVHDLHTVDDGVWKHLLPLAINDTDKWDFLIAHYLGVDHAGHTFGVETPQMIEKLHQMDDQITLTVETLVEAADPNGPHAHTLVLVFGDHGQSLHGDHGGGTWEETESALVAFDVGSIHNKRKEKKEAGCESCPVDDPPLQRGQNGCSLEAVCPVITELDQLDFACNLAMMMGLPIPFGNVGKLSKTLWEFTFGKSDRALIEALNLNVAQVNQYLQMYAQKAGIDPNWMSRLSEQYKKIEVQNESLSVEDYMEYLEMAASFAREKWTQFNDALMICGVALLGTALLAQAYVTWFHEGSTAKCTFLDTVLYVICFIHGVALLSNSYIMAEGRLLGFWIASMIILMMYESLSKHMPQNASLIQGTHGSGLFGMAYGEMKRIWHGIYSAKQAMLYGTGVLLLNICLENVGFVDRTGGNPFDKSSLQPAGLKVAPPLEQLLLHAPLALMPVLLTTRWFCQKPTLTHPSGSSLEYIVSFGKLMVCLEFGLVSMYWIVQDVTRDTHVPFAYTSHAQAQSLVFQVLESIQRLPFHLILPRLVFMLAISTIIILLVGYLCLRSTLRLSDFRSGTLLDYSKAAIGCLLPVVVILAGRVGSLLGMLGVLEIACFLGLAKHTACTPHFLAGMLGLFGVQLFFFTGHFCEFSGLQFVSVFIGYDDFEFYRSGALLLVNTFGPVILCSMALPITRYILWEHSQTEDNTSASSSTTRQGNGKSMKLIPNTGNSTSAPKSQRPLVQYLVFFSIQTSRLFWSMLCAAIQRRHLMIWAIFAPKFAFEAAFTLFLDISVLVMASLMGDFVQT